MDTSSRASRASKRDIYKKYEESETCEDRRLEAAPRTGTFNLTEPINPSASRPSLMFCRSLTSSSARTTGKGMNWYLLDSFYFAILTIVFIAVEKIAVGKRALNNINMAKLWLSKEERSQQAKLRYACARFVKHAM